MRRGCQQEVDDACGRWHPARTACSNAARPARCRPRHWWGSDHAATGGVFFVDRQRVEVDPVQHLQAGRAGRPRGWNCQRLVQPCVRPALDLEAAGQQALRAAATAHAVLHDLPDAQQARVDLGIAAPVPLVAPHDLRDAQVFAVPASAAPIALVKGRGSTVVSGAITFWRVPSAATSSLTIKPPPTE
jgi:hypothetical protein